MIALRMRQGAVTAAADTATCREPSGSRCAGGSRGLRRAADHASGYGGRVTAYAAVVLTGGAARRMGGVDKP
ncbi:MAG: hypothetical protein WA890_15050, partial [Micromonospora sp.]